MKFGSIQVTKKMKEGDCDHCEEALMLGVPHVTVTIRASSKSGKHWFVNWHLHIKCLGLWLIAQLVARQDRRKAAGRPKGSGLRLSPENKRKRLALCKRRMRIFQEVSKCSPKDKRLGEWFTKYETVTKELEDVGGPASVNARTNLDVVATEKKLMYGRSLCKTTT
ncbi:hypothetical protein LCGC14_1841160 [marine sediment metagenome]|uniref:PARP-type domain-containing protein n=1 Tax=marine sediment metagenome TaxID=412755 RepID=A0A0F9GDD1_9ZZZZ